MVSPIGKIFVSLDDKFTATVTYLHTLIAQTLSTLVITLACIYKLDFTLTFFAFILGDKPNICSNTGIVEQVVRQLNDSLQPVVFQQIATDFTFATAGISFEKTAAVLNDCHAAFIVFQFGYTIEQEQHLSITNGRKSGSKSTGFTKVMFFFHCFF